MHTQAPFTKKTAKEIANEIVTDILRHMLGENDKSYYFGFETYQTHIYDEIEPRLVAKGINPTDSRIEKVGDAFDVAMDKIRAKAKTELGKWIAKIEPKH